MSGHIERNKRNEELVRAITGPATLKRNPTMHILDDGQCRRIDGQHIVGNMVVVNDQGQVMLDGDSVVTTRQRFRIPKGHPWRGVRP